MFRLFYKRCAVVFEDIRLVFCSCVPWGSIELPRLPCALLRACSRLQCRRPLVSLSLGLFCCGAVYFVLLSDTKAKEQHLFMRANRSVSRTDEELDPGAAVERARTLLAGVGNRNVVRRMNESNI
ncbi:hypothetical protein LSAT2_001302 [Lamellibrachia satsuma]|nr:hypothetical protein LSAT2_001302 [Lamellibrachia satsuma]